MAAPRRSPRVRSGWTGALVAVGLALAACTAQAATCSAPVLDRVRALPSALAPHARIVAQACKPWPYDPSVTLAAVAYARDGAEPGARTLDLRVAMLSSADATVLASDVQTLQEDALLELDADALRLDTARYYLAPGQRAFALVLHSAARGPSCPDFFSSDELTLLVRDGTRLRPVLRQPLHAWRLLGGQPCNRDETPVVSETAEVGIAVGEERHAGFADLRLEARVTQRRDDPNQDQPQTQSRRERQTLRYDGHRYRPVASDKAPFWAPQP